MRFGSATKYRAAVLMIISVWTVVALCGCAARPTTSALDGGVDGASPEAELQQLLEGQGAVYKARETMRVTPMEDGALDEMSIEARSLVDTESPDNWEVFSRVSSSDDDSFNYDVFDIPGRTISVYDDEAYEEASNESGPSGDSPLQWAGALGEVESVVLQEEDGFLHFQWKGMGTREKPLMLVYLDGPLTVDYWFDADGVLQRQLITAEGGFSYSDNRERVQFSCEAQFEFVDEVTFPPVPSETIHFGEGTTEQFVSELEGIIGSTGDNVTMEATVELYVEDGEDMSLTDASFSVYIDGEDRACLMSIPSEGIEDVLVRYEDGETTVVSEGETISVDDAEGLGSSSLGDSDSDLALVRAAGDITKYLYPDRTVGYSIMLDVDKIPENIWRSSFRSVDEGSAMVVVDIEGRLESVYYELYGPAAQGGDAYAITTADAKYSDYGTTVLP